MTAIEHHGQSYRGIRGSDVQRDGMFLELWSAPGARRSSMQTLLVGVGCGGVLGLLPGVAVWKPRAALAEARLPWAESAALSGLMKAAVGRPQRCEGSLALG